MSSESSSFTDAEWLCVLHAGEPTVALQYLAQYPTTPLAAVAVDTVVKGGEGGAGVAEVSKILVPRMRGVVWASVWLAYLNLLKKSKVNMKLINTALDAAGKDPNSYLLWRRCIELARDLSSGSGDVTQERALYQRAVVLPLFSVEALLGEYRSFEESSTGSKNVQLPKELLDQHENAVRVAKLLRLAYTKAGATTWVVPKGPQDATKEPALYREQQQSLQQWKEATLNVLAEAEADVTTAANASSVQAVWALSVDWHFKKLVSLFPTLEEVWGDYVLAVMSHEFLGGPSAASLVVKEALSKCEDSALLHLLQLEVKGLEGGAAATQGMNISVEDCEAVAKEVGPIAGMVAFSRLDPVSTPGFKKTFRSLGKDAVARGAADWLVYKLWAGLERYTLEDLSLVKKILTNASKKFPTPGLLGTQLLLSSQAFAEEQLDTQEALKLHEGFVTEVSTVQRSTGGDLIVAPLVVGSGPMSTSSMGGTSGRYVPQDGLRRMAWQRFCRFERVFQGTHVQTLQERRQDELDPAQALVPTTSTAMLQKIHHYSVGLLAPVPDDQLELYQTLSLLGPAKVRKELEERGDFHSPLKLQSLALNVTCPEVPHCAIRPCVPRAAGTVVEGGWQSFTMPVNTNPAKPNDDPHTSVPCGPRTMKGNLQRKLVLDIAGRRLQKKIEAEQRAAQQKEDEKQFATRGLPAQLAGFLEQLPVVEEITKHEGKGFAQTQAKFSAVRILGKFHHLWLLKELQKWPKDALVPPRQ